MTEQQKDENLLADLLQLPADAADSAATHSPALTRSEEQKLLREANEVEPATLAPDDTATHGESAASFASEVVETVRRHPIPALLIAMGMAYLLTRRRR